MLMIYHQSDIIYFLSSLCSSDYVDDNDISVHIMLDHTKMHIDRKMLYGFFFSIRQQQNTVESNLFQTAQKVPLKCI